MGLLAALLFAAVDLRSRPAYEGCGSVSGAGDGGRDGGGGGLFCSPPAGSPRNPGLRPLAGQAGRGWGVGRHTALFAFRWPRPPPLAGAFVWSLRPPDPGGDQRLGASLGPSTCDLGLAPFFLIVPLARFRRRCRSRSTASACGRTSSSSSSPPSEWPEATGLAFAWLDDGLLLLQALVGGLVYAAGTGARRPGGGGPRRRRHEDPAPCSAPLLHSSGERRSPSGCSWRC